MQCVLLDSFLLIKACQTPTCSPSPDQTQSTSNAACKQPADIRLGRRFAPQPGVAFMLLLYRHGAPPSRRHAQVLTCHRAEGKAPIYYPLISRKMLLLCEIREFTTAQSEGLRLGKSEILWALLWMWLSCSAWWMALS